MGRKSDIRSEISSLEGKIREYQNCIDYLREVEVKIKTKMTFFDEDVYQKINAYSTSDDDNWIGNDAHTTAEQKGQSCSTIYSMISDAEDLIYGIHQTISKYENMITDCRNRISSLNSELDAILEAERREAQQYLL